MTRESGRLGLDRPELVVFGSLPMLAAFGPLLTLYSGLFAFRAACALVIAHAVLFLMGHQRWSASDKFLASAVLWFAAAGLAGLGRVTSTSDNPYSEFFSVMLGLLTALAVRAWQRRLPGIYLALARGWVIAGLVSCGVACVEVLTGAHLPNYLLEAAPDPAATFGNPNSLGMFVVMANVWAMPVRRCGARKWRGLTYLLALASPPVLSLTDARLAMVVWLMVLGASVWFGVRFSRTRGAYLVGAAIPTVAAIGAVAMFPSLAGYATEAATAGTSGGVRQALTVQGLEFAVEQRGLPTWPGAFESLMLERGDLVSTAGLINAHNTWVELLVQYGLPSLLLVLGWMIACIASTSEPRGEAVVAVIALLALGVVNSSSLDDAAFWLFIATLAASTRNNPADTERPSPAEPHHDVVPREVRPCT